MLNIKTARELATSARKRPRFIKVGVFDIDGIMRGKYMAATSFCPRSTRATAFATFVLAWDSNDQLYDNVSLTGWHTAYPDAAVRLLPETTRLIPFENDLPLVLSEFTGAHEAACPRGTLRRVLKRAEGMGFECRQRVEFEFFMFEETPHSCAKKAIAT